MNDSFGNKQRLIKAISPFKQRAQKPDKSEPERAVRERKKAGERQHREAAERLAKEMAVIAEIGRVICSTTDIDEVYERFAAEARKLIPFDRITVSLCDTRRNLITVAYVSGADLSSYKQGDSFPITGTLIEEVLQKRTGLIIQSEAMDEIVSRIPTFSRNFRAGLRSLVGVPLTYKDAVVGILFFWSKTPDAYTEQDLRLAEKIGNQIAGAITNAQLFSDLKKTELSLRESEGRFRALVEQAAVGVAEVQIGTGRFFTVNRSLCEMVGWTMEELLSATFHAITHPEDLHLHEKKKAMLIAGKIGHYSLEKRYIRKDGGIVWVNLTVSPLWKPGEAPGRHITVIENITERKQAEEALQRAHDELKETNTALRVLLNRGDMDRRMLEESLRSNISQLIVPFLSRLKMSQSNQERLTCLNILETNLVNITSPFINRLSAAYKNLTPKEVQVAELVKQGKRTKEIAELMGVSVGTVDTHRNNIRKKMELNSKNDNLRSHLLSLT